MKNLQLQMEVQVPPGAGQKPQAVALPIAAACESSYGRKPAVWARWLLTHNVV